MFYMLGGSSRYPFSFEEFGSIYRYKSSIKNNNEMDALGQIQQELVSGKAFLIALLISLVIFAL